METPELLREAPLDGNEADTLVGSLERQRIIFAWKCRGLDAAAMSTQLGPSTMTLGGLVKHLALVESDHFSRLLHREGPGEPWAGVDWDARPDWEWETAADNSPAELFALWESAVTRSRALVTAALAIDGPDTLGDYVTRDGTRPKLRRILIDMVEEYARHVGHADLIRESIDGLVGEDPPND